MRGEDFKWQEDYMQGGGKRYRVALPVDGLKGDPLRFGGYLHRPLSYVGLQIRSHRRMLAWNC